MLSYMTRTFLPRGDGFHFSSAAPADIIDRRFLNDEDPWKVLACTLANLQLGNFDVAAVPIGLMKRCDDLVLWIACVDLVGYAAPTALVKSLFEQFSQPAYETRMRYICSAAFSAGGFWAVDQVIDIYLNSTNADEMRYLEFELSWLLEDESGGLSSGPKLIEVRDAASLPFDRPELIPDIQAFAKLAKERATSLHKSSDVSSGLAVCEGKPFNIQNVAEILLTRLRRGDGSHPVDRGRMLLEATTGLDCHGFYSEKGLLQCLNATAIVEDYLESADSERYEPGLRYFFGHRIPD